MNATLRWIRFEAIMIATLSTEGIGAPIFNSFRDNPISSLERS